MTSYWKLLNKLETFFNAHIQVKKFGGEFREQMPNFSTMDERYPLVYVVPTSETSGMNTNVFTLDVYCVDIIQKDRANINTILSDTQLILNDLYLYYTDGNDLSIDIISDPTMTPLNNFDLDYVAGWVGTFTFEVNQYSVCEIPLEPITPVVVECLPANYLVEYENGTDIQSGTIPSGGSLTIQIPDPIECEDARVRITDTAENILYEQFVPSGGNYEQTISDSVISNSDDSYLTNVLSEQNLELPDVTFTIENTTATIVNSAVVPSVTNQTLIAPDATIQIKKEGDGTIHVEAIPSGVTETYFVQDNDLTVNQAFPFSIHATDPLDIRLHNQSGNDITPTSVVYNGNANHVTCIIDTSSFVPVGATLQKTGQTTSYNQYDDGATQRGRLTSFLVLPSNNPFGNTNRFTSKAGTQVYTDSVVIDWSTYNGSTVLAYYHGDTNTRPWATQCTQHLTSTFNGLTGWNLVNFVEMVNIMDFSLMVNYQLNYAPFSTTRRYFWVSTQPAGTVGVATDLAGYNPFTSAGKTGALWGIWVRVCNVSGTNIT